MKIAIHIFTALFFGMGFCHATPELDTLEEKIRMELRGTHWKIVKDWRSITLITTNVQFLNPLGLPVVESEKELWKQYSFISDYRITVTLDTKVTQSEYEELIELKRQLMEKRTAGVKRNTKNFAGESRNAEGVIRLPSYYLYGSSVYFYTSDDGFFMLRPESVRIIRDKVAAVLDKSCLKYSTKAESDDGAFNGSQPIRSETNGTSSTAGSRR